MRQAQSSGELTWPMVVLAVRNLLLDCGKLSGSELGNKWEACYGYSMCFPFFGIADWAALVAQLQPGALTILDRRTMLMQASSEAAWTKEQASWTSLGETAQETAQEWLLAG